MIGFIFLILLLLLPTSPDAGMIYICEQPDGTISVTNPNPALRQDTETEEEFVTRIGEKYLNDMGTPGLPCTVQDQVQLPERARANPLGNSVPVRNAWRMKPDRSGVRVDESRVPPEVRR